MHTASLMQPLAGKHILVTRAIEQFDAVAEQIRQQDAIAIAFPCLGVQCLAENIRQSLRNLPENTCILLTSANAVHCAANALGSGFIPCLEKYQTVAVGPRTAAALSTYGISPTWVADTPSQEGLIDGFIRHGIPQHVCFLRAEQGRDTIQQALEKSGTQVQRVTAYRTVCPTDDASVVVQKLKSDAIDAVLIGSSRCALHYVLRIGDLKLADRPAIAVISRQVARAAEGAGLNVQCIAKETSFTGMLDALAVYFNSKPHISEEEHP
ncbi:MAG: uroporphyrinogen-III synthase [Mariprofundaceae bacterium]